MKPLSMQTVCLSPQPSDCKRPTHSSSRSESVLLSAAWRAFPHHHSTAWCSGSNLQSCGLLCDCVRICVMTRGHSEDYTFINNIYIYMVGVWAEWAKILKTFKYFWISFISNHLSFVTWPSLHVWLWFSCTGETQSSHHAEFWVMQQLKMPFLRHEMW